MNFALYLQMQLAISFVILYMGYSLVFDKIPKNLNGTIYDISRKYLGIGYFVMSITSFVYYFTDLRFKPDYYTIAINLTAYYTILIMFKVAFFHLLGKKQEFYDPDFVRDIASCFTFPLPVWSMIWYGREDWINIALILTDIYFVLCVIYYVVKFAKLYREEVNEVNNYFSDDMEGKVNWMMRSVYLIISLGAVASVSVFSVPHYLWVGYAFMFYGLFTYTYVYRCFHNFMVTYEYIKIPDDMDDKTTEQKVVKPKPQLETNPTQINSETYNNIKKQLNRWIDEHGYTQNGVTIQSLASQICTNRTYLSNYINSTYGCSFKSWITRLRIDRAKKLLLENDSININDVSTLVGCSSPASFNHLFKTQERMSPARWRTINRKK